MEESERLHFINMKRELLKAVVFLLIVCAVLYKVFGPFWSKKGIFFNGIKSQEEFYQILREYQAIGIQAYSQNQYVKLSADGSGVRINEIFFRYKGGNSLRTYSFFQSMDDIVKVMDEHENRLHFEVAKEGTNYQYTVSLPKAVQPGETFAIKTVSNCVDLAKKKDLWTYERYHIPGCETVYTEIVIFPAGAEVVSITPEPAERHKEKGLVSLCFKAHLQKMEPFKCKIEYQFKTSSVGDASDTNPTR